LQTHLLRNCGPEQPRRVLVFRIGELGDALIALPALNAIRQTFPDAHISLLSNTDRQNRHITPNQILPKGVIDEWVSYRSRDFRSTLADRLSLLKRLRRERYDLLIYLAPHIRAKRDVRRDLFFFRRAGISKVIGTKGFQALPPRANGRLPAVAHETDLLLHRLSLDGIESPPMGKAKFELDLTTEEEETTNLWLEKEFANVQVNYIIGFGPGSKWPSKIWPEDRFLDLGRQLVQHLNIFPIVFGGLDDQALGDRLISAWGQGANAAGALSVRQAAIALRECDAYVGNDTGTMHLAAAVGTRCVAIMAAIDWPGHWSPYGQGHLVLRRTVPCEGCLLRVCEREGMKCLKEIGVDDVFHACCQVLGFERAESSQPLVRGVAKM